MKKVLYIKPTTEIYHIYDKDEDICKYNSNVGNFGPGDKDDDDREGDDNWDDDWSWTHN